MLGFICGKSTTYRRLKMPVQMIELEEVTMFEYSDDAFEATVAGYGGASYIPKWC